MKNLYKLSLLMLMLFTFVFTGCVGQKSENMNDNIVRIEIWDNVIDFNMQDNIPVHDLAKVTTEFELPVKVSGSDKYKVYLNGEEIKKGETTIQIDEISQNKIIEFKFVDRKSGQEYVKNVRTYPMSAPKFIVHPKDVMDGHYFFSVNGFIYKMNSLGNIDFYWNLGGVCLDFKETITKDGKYYSFFKENRQDASITTGYVPASAIILDDKFNVVDEIKYLSQDGKVNYECVLDSHDIIVLGKNHYIIMGYVGELVNNISESIPYTNTGVRVVNNVVQEIKDGNLIWEWSGTDYPELYNVTMFSNDFYNVNQEWFDYLHMNSLQIDPKDGNLLVSVRDTCSILKIDRKTGNILWTLGGEADEFGLTAEQKLSLQHFARYNDDGTITAFDNGVYHDGRNFDMTKGATRVVEYKIDEQNKKLLDFKEFKVDNQFSNIMGSAQKLSDGKFVIGWGGRVTQNVLFSEIDFNTNQTEFFVSYPHTSFESDTYRVHKTTTK